MRLPPFSLRRVGQGGEVITKQQSRGDVLNSDKEKSAVSWRTTPVLWKKLKPLAREMRNKPTEAENILWQQLRNKQISGFIFRRQFSIERFIVDFYCPRRRLVIEIDGLIHRYQQDEDAVRQAFIEQQGFHLIRFSNDEVINNLEMVINQISEALTVPLPNK
jgi:very-short-patch-repair endonuclease